MRIEKLLGNSFRELFYKLEKPINKVEIYRAMIAVCVDLNHCTNEM